MAKKEKEIKTKTKKQKSHYFKDMKAELKKVIWPTPKQLATNTIGVIAFTLIIAVIVLVLDLCFDAINKYGITAAQEKIQSSYSTSTDESEEQTGSDAESSGEDVGGDTTEDGATNEDENAGQSVEVEPQAEVKSDDSGSQE